MRQLKIVLTLLVALASAGVTEAQSTSGTISGRVVDAQGGVLPGVTVTVESASLQGARTAVTTENGDYQLPLLPAGVYTVSFELSGFEQDRRTVIVATAQTVPLDVTLGVGRVSESVTVTASAAEVQTKSAQVVTSFRQDLIANLPTSRDINAVMLLAPGVHATGPAGNFSVSGSMTFDNLFLVNGVTVNENLRGQAQNLFIEDAIQETTVATAGVSAEFGRFSGGVVNVITKSGGNAFSGSFRNTLNNDNWRALVQRRANDSFAADSKINKVVPKYEYTFGGPVLKDRLWFFTAGRLETRESSRQLVLTNVPYTYTDKNRRYEAKGTFSANASHRFQGSYTKLSSDVLNDVQSQSTAADLNSLFDRSVPEDLVTFNYSGVLTPKLFLEAQYSARDLSLIGSGSKYTDPIKGTLIVDTQGRRYWAPTFCGVCDPETRDNREFFVKGTYFLSTKDAGSHTMIVGYDDFDDKRFANNHQSGSDFRILNAPGIMQGTSLIPSFISGTTQIRWQPILIDNVGTSFRTLSLFANDNWRLSDRLTANLGLRWDKNNGRDGSGQLVATQSAFSPRLGVVWAPSGHQDWTVTGSVAKYVSAILNSIADSASPGGNPDTYTFVYRGPDINTDPGGPTLSPEAALQQLFDWYKANGAENLPLTGAPTVRGVSAVIGDSLRPPSTWEYAGGVNRQFGSRAAIRSDLIYRNYQDFYVQRLDTTTGKVVDNRSFAPATVRGRVYDLAIIENDSSGTLKRRYVGLSNQAQFRFSPRFDVGGNYTISRLWGNADGESVNAGPITSGVFSYPEYAQESWAFPEGDLSADQRHRARVWVNYGVPKVAGLSLNVLEILESGVPYSASNQNGALFNGVDPSRWVTNPGYQTVPDGGSTQYYFTARDAFRTEGQRRTDLAINYSRGVGVSGHDVNLFIQAQIANLFNQAQLCGCGATVFVRDGAVQNQYIDSSIRTNVSTPALYAQFNPFTTTPVEGVNWAKSPTFGAALNRLAYTSPRSFRISFGIRF